MLADELKEHTRDVHAALEKKLLTHIQVVDNAEQYRSLLTLMYGYYAAVERQLESFKDSLPDYDRRRKSQAILGDLQQLGYATDALPVCHDVPIIDSVPSALGAMYVLEGSTLGGKVISRMLLRQVPALDGSINFFQGYCDETMDMWQKFKDHLHFSVNEPNYHKANMAAKETFVKFKNWLEYHDAD